MSTTPFTLFVQTVDQKTTLIHDVTNDITVENLKEKIMAVNGMAVSQQQLVFDGQKLVDNCKNFYSH
jgi:hypothetical protein